MSYMEEYKRKLVSADEAVKVVKSGDWVWYGEFALFPTDCDAALARRKDELEDVKINLTLVPDRVPKVVEADFTQKHFIFHDWHFGVPARKLHDNGLAFYGYTLYGQAERSTMAGSAVNVIFQPVTPMDERGFFNLSTSCSAGPYRFDRVKNIDKGKIVVEVNPAYPWCYGGNQECIHISEVDYIVETTNPGIFAVPGEIPVTDIDKKIAGHIMELLEDRDCIQIGIGGMPNTVGKLIAQSDLKDLGVHTEMMADCYVDMYEAGKITGKYKTTDKGKMVYTFALGRKELYEFLDRNPVCATYPVGYTNDPFLISRNDQQVSINNALQVDLYGQVASEARAGRHITGVGGQFDYHFGAYLSRKGKPIIALSSTVKRPDGTVESRITSTLDPGTIVTVPRAIASIIVTEYGAFDMRANTMWQRAEGLINIAHPDFRDELVKEAQRLKIWRKTNKI